MSRARDIRESQNRYLTPATATAACTAAEARIAAPPSHPRPERASVSTAGARAAFERHLLNVSAVFAPVAAPDDVPAAIAAFVQCELSR